MRRTRVGPRSSPEWKIEVRPAQLGPAIGGLHGVSITVGGVLAAEKGIWEAARQNVADLGRIGRDAAQALADSGTTPGLNTI